VQPDRHKGRVSLSRLALWLSWPSIIGEFGPGSPIVCEPSFGAAPLARECNSGESLAPQELLSAFRRSVARLTSHGAAQHVGVSMSGGLDSLAVFDALLALGHRPTVFVCDLRDDAGGSAKVHVARQLEASGFTGEMVVVRPDAEPSTPAVFDRRGPRLDAVPAVNQVMSEEAAIRGCTVLLTGSGGDEALGSPRFLLAQLLRTAPAHAAGYIRDSLLFSRQARRLEPLSAGASLLPRRTRATVYVAAAWPELCTESPPDVLSPKYSQISADYSRAWLQDLVHHHATHHSAWSTMEACDAVWPQYRLGSNGPTAFESPFLTRQFLEASQRLPLPARYDARREHAYWRQKAAVFRLLTPLHQRSAPTAKLTYSRYLASVAPTPNSHLLAKYGLVSNANLDRHVDVLIRARLVAVERWLAEALTEGYDVTD
jgi:asparagine synthetase B (glutamine-hydrolysing)